MSFPKYEAYKDSGVEWLGEVPEHWGIYSLKRSVEGCVNGIWGNDPDEIDDIPVIRVADFDRTLAKVSLSKLTYRSIPPKDRQSRLLQSGDLLIEKSGGGEKTLVGCVVLFNHDFEAVTSNFVARMRPHIGFDSSFLCYAFDTLYQGRVNFSSIKQTTGIQNLDSESYLQEYFCFPPLVEQIQIACLLDHETARIDALIAEQQRLIELLKEKRQAVISHAVTKGLDPTAPMKESGVEWLGEVPTHWEIKKLKHGVHIQGGFAFQSSDFTDEGIQLIKIANLYMNELQPGRQPTFLSPSFLESHSEWIVSDGDILMSLTGTLGKRDYGFAILVESEEKYLLNQRVARLRAHRLFEPHFLRFLLLSESYLCKLYSLPAGTKQANLSNDDVVGIKVAVPPKEEQVSICIYLERMTSRIDSLIVEAESVINFLQERRSALISAAVTGKIDVRGWQAPASASPAPTLEPVHG